MKLPLNWREDVCNRFPEFRQRFDDYECDTPYLVWFQLRDAFMHAYDRSPRDDALIRRIYDYAFWCTEAAARGETAEDDLFTCVAVSFLEHIPQHPLARADMPRWFSYDDFVGSAQIFGYHLSEQEFADLKQYFHEHKDMYAPDRTRSQTA